MEFHQLKTFLVVAELGSITRAAGQLHLSQPAVSAHIKALEAVLNLTLFERTPRGMQLTEHGTRLVPKAREAVAAHAGVLREAERLHGDLAGELRLGLGANSDSSSAGALVSKLGELHGGVRVSLREGDSKAVVEDILAGRLDAGFFNVDPAEAAIPTGLHTVGVARFGLQLVGPVGTLDGTALDWTALARQTWICPPRTSGCGRAVHALLRREHIQPTQVIEVDRESSTRALVTAGTGVGVLHAYTAQAASGRGELEVLCDVELNLEVLLGVLEARRHEPLLAAVLALASG